MTQRIRPENPIPEFGDSRSLFPISKPQIQKERKFFITRLGDRVFCLIQIPIKDEKSTDYSENEKETEEEEEDDDGCVLSCLIFGERH